METKLKRLLKRKKISQKRLYQMICEEYETPVGLYALNQIVNGKKLNYHLITLVKICKVLKCQPHSIVETEVLHERLKRLKDKIYKNSLSIEKNWKEEVIEDNDNKWSGGKINIDESDDKSLNHHF
tara:strand:- start:1027 stop:1404 length:378 start_codon:yes stop_codon:yes gene_type:complete